MIHVDDESRRPVTIFQRFLKMRKSIFSASPLHYLNNDKTILIKLHANKSYIVVASLKTSKARFKLLKIYLTILAKQSSLASL